MESFFNVISPLFIRKISVIGTPVNTVCGGGDVSAVEASGSFCFGCLRQWLCTLYLETRALVNLELIS